MIAPLYRAQADLLLQVLPHVAKEDCFALKGGTAINLFVRQMPRLSVDIDLTYLPFDDRTTAMAGIAEALQRVKTRVEATIAGSKLALIPQSDGPEAKLVCQVPGAQIKIEVNTTIRGHAPHLTVSIRAIYLMFITCWQPRALRRTSAWGSSLFLSAIHER
jgi:Nucleotidyl transferase AbiEii toxin, Type IV TA system